MRRSRRRVLLLATAVLAAAPFARAQAPDRLLALGLLFPNPTTSADADAREYIPRWLKALGWVDGKNLRLEFASAEGREERLPALAGKLVAKGVDAIWVAGTEAALAAARATESIPIAFYGVGHPVEQGLVESLAKPGRNVTGITSIAGLEWGKGLEALREIAPSLRRLARIRVQTVARHVSGHEVSIRDNSTEADAQRMGFEVRRFGVAAPEDLDGAFTAILESRPEGLMCDFTAMTFRERHRIIGFANRNRLPSLFGALPFVRDGGLVSYAASRSWMAQHSFTFVDRILRGARPADLPVELPTRFELLVNLKTAKALGLTVPESILLRADRVYE